MKLSKNKLEILFKILNRGGSAIRSTITMARKHGNEQRMASPGHPQVYHGKSDTINLS